MTPIFHEGMIVKFEADSGIRAAIMLDSLFKPRDKVDLLVGSGIVRCKYNKKKNVFSPYRSELRYSCREAEIMAGSAANYIRHAIEKVHQELPKRGSK